MNFRAAALKISAPVYFHKQTGVIGRAVCVFELKPNIKFLIVILLRKFPIVGRNKAFAAVVSYMSYNW